MPLDPQAKTVLDQLATLKRPPMQTLTPAEARAQTLAAPRAPGPQVHRVAGGKVPGPGGDIPVRTYTPAGRGPFPGLVYFHGGGWVICNLDTHDGTVRHIVDRAGCVAVSVDYRLAPEHRFPAGPEDCYAATKYVAEHAGELNIDPKRIAIAGDSAGGNLTAVVALMARDRGGPALVHQVMLYPVIDRNYQTRSYQDNASGYLLTKEMMVWFWDLYLRSPADASHPYAAPIKAADLRGVAPATIITAEFDPLRDEGEAYARRLQQAGVPTVCTRYDGMIHGFFGMVEAMDRSRQAMQQVAAALKRAYGT